MFYSVPGGWLLFVYSWHSCMSSYWQDILLTHCIVLSVSGILHPLRQNFPSLIFLNFSHNILEIGVYGIRCFKAYSPYASFLNCFAFIKEMSTSYMLPICVTTKPCMELLTLFSLKNANWSSHILNHLKTIQMGFFLKMNLPVKFRLENSAIQVSCKVRRFYQISNI